MAGASNGSDREDAAYPVRSPNSTAHSSAVSGSTSHIIDTTADMDDMSDVVIVHTPNTTPNNPTHSQQHASDNHTPASSPPPPCRPSGVADITVSTSSMNPDLDTKVANVHDRDTIGASTNSMDASSVNSSTSLVPQVGNGVSSSTPTSSNANANALTNSSSNSNSNSRKERRGSGRSRHRHRTAARVASSAGSQSTDPAGAIELTSLLESTQVPTDIQEDACDKFIMSHDKCYLFDHDAFRTLMSTLLTTRLLNAAWFNAASSGRRLRLLQLLRLLSRDRSVRSVLSKTDAPRFLCQQFLSCHHLYTDPNTQRQERAALDDMLIELTSLMKRLASKHARLIVDQGACLVLWDLLSTANPDVLHCTLNALNALLALPGHTDMLQGISDRLRVDMILHVISSRAAALKEKAVDLLKRLLDSSETLQLVINSHTVSTCIPVLRARSLWSENNAVSLFSSLVELLRIMMSQSDDAVEQFREQKGEEAVAALLNTSSMHDSADAMARVSRRSQLDLHLQAALLLSDLINHHSECLPSIVPLKLLPHFNQLLSTCKGSGSQTVQDACVIFNHAYKALREYTQRSNRRVVNGYVLEEKLGRGAFAEVYSCHREGVPHVKFALKELRIRSGKIDVQHHMAETAVSDAEREIDMLKKLSHPNIVKYIDNFATGDKYYIVMELCRGVPLDAYLRSLPKGTGLSEKGVWTIFIQLTMALAYMHVEMDVVHRDLHPRNVMIDGSDLTVKITDFGLARIKPNHDRTLTSYAGCPNYSAPEIVGRKAKAPDMPKTDVWALGCILYHLATLEQPFPNSDSIFTVSQNIVDANYPRMSSFAVAQQYRPLVQRIQELCMTTEPQLRPHILDVASMISPLLVSSLHSAIAFRFQYKAMVRAHISRPGYVVGSAPPGLQDDSGSILNMHTASLFPPIVSLGDPDSKSTYSGSSQLSSAADDQGSDHTSMMHKIGFILSVGESKCQDRLVHQYCRGLFATTTPHALHEEVARLASRSNASVVVRSASIVATSYAIMADRIQAELASHNYEATVALNTPKHSNRSQSISSVSSSASLRRGGSHRLLVSAAGHRPSTSNSRSHRIRASSNDSIADTGSVSGAAHANASDAAAADDQHQHQV
jgi:serine/threonine protein kinase